MDEKLLVGHALSSVGYRVYPDTPFQEVLDLMVRRQVHAVPIVGADYEVLGIITTGDALHAVLRSGVGRAGSAGKDAGPLLARDVMTRTVLCVSEEQGLMEAAQMMANRDVEQLPVVRDGVLVGFLNRDAVLRALSGGGESEHDDPGSREGEP